MPLKKSANKSKKAINSAIAANIKELYYNGSKKRPMNQIVAIAESSARGRKSKKKKK